MEWSDPDDELVLTFCNYKAYEITFCRALLAKTLTVRYICSCAHSAGRPSATIGYLVYKSYIQA